MDALTQLVIIWLGVFLAVFLAKKTRLTPVLFFLFVGALFVNTGILPVESDALIRGLAEIGIIVIMFAIGFEENTANFLGSIKRSWGIALFGAIGPFVAAYAVADAVWANPNISMLTGLTMTATAVSLTMVSLKGEGLNKSAAATGIMTSAVLDDIASLALVAILVPFATGNAPTDMAAVGLILGKAILFFVGVIILGVIVFPHNRRGVLGRFPILQKFALRTVLSFDRGAHITLTILTLAVAVGLGAHALGFHPAVGAYMAGLVLKEEYFDLLGGDENYFAASRKAIDNLAFSWIGPIFFVDLGTKIVFDWGIFVSVIPEVAILTALLIVVQTSTAGLAARFTGGFSNSESLLIGLGMLGRAELAFVVMDIAYVQNHIFTDEVFYTLMFTAFWLNVSVPISIALWKRRFGNAN